MPRKSAIPTELRALLAEAKTLKATERAHRADLRPLRDHRHDLTGRVHWTRRTLTRRRSHLAELQAPTDGPFGIVLFPWRREQELAEAEQAVIDAERTLAERETTLALFDACHQELQTTETPHGDL